MEIRRATLDLYLYLIDSKNPKFHLDNKIIYYDFSLGEAYDVTIGEMLFLLAKQVGVEAIYKIYDPGKQIDPISNPPPIVLWARTKVALEREIQIYNIAIKKEPGNKLLIDWKAELENKLGILNSSTLPPETADIFQLDKISLDANGLPTINPIINPFFNIK